jgi:hypothetical protein
VGANSLVKSTSPSADQGTPTSLSMSDDDNESAHIRGELSPCRDPLALEACHHDLFDQAPRIRVGNDAGP